MSGERGLQAERTSLSWSRTALALVTNAVLALVRHPLSSPLYLVLAGTSLVMAAAVAVTGRRRARLLATDPLPTPLAPHRAVLGLGMGTALLGAVTAATIVWTTPS